MRLASKILLLSTSISLSVGIGSALWGGALIEKALINNLAEQGRYIASALSEAYATDITHGNVIPIQEGIRHISKERESVSYIYMVNFNNKLLAHTFKQGFPDEIANIWQEEPAVLQQTSFFDLASGEQFIEIRHPIIRGLPGMVHIGLVQTHVREQVEEIRLRIMTIALLIALIGAAIGTGLSRRFTQPLNTLTSLIDQYRQGEIPQFDKINIKKGGLELRALSHAFENMIHERIEFESGLQRAAIVFDNTLEGIFITDKNSIIMSTNQAFSNITGYRKEDVIGKTPRIMKSDYHDQKFYDDFWASIKEKGAWQGEIWNRRKDGGIFPSWQTVTAVKDNQDNISHFVSVFSDITEKKMTEEHIQHLAHHDALTNLPNRLLFNERLGQAIKHAGRNKKIVALLFLDLDRFKNINDSLGHPAGDDILQKISQRLLEQVRGEDTVARLGGDEFTILLDSLDCDQDAILVAQKVLDAFAAPFPIRGHQLSLTVSIGIGLYPQDGTNVDTLLRNADAAMYRAKEQGKNNYQFYTQELTNNAFERVSIENKLRLAIKCGELQLHYQPQLSLNDNKIVGVEALLRWNHPQDGMISPAKFIPVTEETGLIVEIGEWALRTACHQAKQWIDNNVPFGSMAVNISGIQVQRSDIVATVAKALEESGLPPERLELEITESIIMHDTEQAIKIMEALRALGVSLSIDDFGTGYSSLSALQQFPISTLKIDQSFVRNVVSNPDDATIVDTIIQMGRNMDMDVVAEGVEDEAQLVFLQKLGCTYVQGLLFGDPMSSDNYLELLLAQADGTDTYRTLFA